MLSNVGGAEETALDIVVADIRDRSSLTPSLLEVGHNRLTPDGKGWFSVHRG